MTLGLLKWPRALWNAGEVQANDSLCEALTTHWTLDALDMPRGRQHQSTPGAEMGVGCRVCPRQQPRGRIRGDPTVCFQGLSWQPSRAGELPSLSGDRRVQ